MFWLPFLSLFPSPNKTLACLHLRSEMHQIIRQGLWSMPLEILTMVSITFYTQSAFLYTVCMLHFITGKRSLHAWCPSTSARARCPSGFGPPADLDPRATIPASGFGPPLADLVPPAKTLLLSFCILLYYSFYFVIQRCTCNNDPDLSMWYARGAHVYLTS